MKRLRRSHGFFVFSDHSVVATFFRFQILHIKNQPTFEKKLKMCKNKKALFFFNEVRMLFVLIFLAVIFCDTDGTMAKNIKNQIKQKQKQNI